MRPRTELALAVTILLSGCLRAEAPNPFSDRIERQELIEVTVENELPGDREVFAYWERRNTAVRLGVVPGRSRETFTTRWWSTGVKFTRRRGFDYYQVRAGDHLEFVIGGATSMIPRRAND